ncbi:hypothetical protein ACSD30_000745 [Escherichia coli]|nr:hypothetical protein [Escherichia coli]EJG8081932.1 hypothetical protein [Escherichia coli]ELO1960224.1 hypothetical protein [Escherichia coli]ELO3079129.1 hypothetical protein [Escherichia coli]ELO3209617.1 hypothetical protein [Escherichia coli]
MKVSISEVFGRINNNGTVTVLYADSGIAVNRLDVDGLYPVGSELSTRYDHPEGIEITVEDAQRFGIEIE